MLIRVLGAIRSAFPTGTPHQEVAFTTFWATRGRYDSPRATVSASPSMWADQSRMEPSTDFAVSYAPKKTQPPMLSNVAHQMVRGRGKGGGGMNECEREGEGGGVG